MKKLLLGILLLCSMHVNAQNYYYDVNGDGKVDISDVTCLTNHLLGRLNKWEDQIVDLGLSVKWAKCNIGAENAEDYGSYFAWGETTGYTSSDGHSFAWTNYSFGSKATLTKYCTSSSYGTVDNNTTLESTDDAASVIWGGTWRMPTDDELTELQEKCTWTWTTLNGVKGCNIQGPNGNSIFLPAAGYCNDTAISNTGKCCYYWSSSLYQDDPSYSSSMNFGCFSGSKITYFEWLDERFYGHTIRPVCP